MKLYYIKWNDCIHNFHIVIINARNSKERDTIFDKWCEDNPGEAPTAYSPRVITIKQGTCIHMNEAD